MKFPKASEVLEEWTAGQVKNVDLANRGGFQGAVTFHQRECLFHLLDFAMEKAREIGRTEGRLEYVEFLKKIPCIVHRECDGGKRGCRDGFNAIVAFIAD